MKHIKLFESLNKYVQVSSADYERRSQKFEPFSESEISYISNHIHNITANYGLVFEVRQAENRFELITYSLVITYSSPIHPVPPNYFLLNIKKCDDDYFYVFDFLYYKCDEMEGVINCITDIIKTKFDKKTKHIKKFESI